MIYLLILQLLYIIYLHWYVTELKNYAFKSTKNCLDLHEMSNKALFVVQDQLKKLAIAINEKR